MNPLTRFSTLLPLEKLANLNVTIVGVGGIGAPAALAIAKMGVASMTLWDSDKVEEVNQGPQMYGRRALNRPKVQALAAHLRDQAPWTEVKTRVALFEQREGERHDVLVTAVDSLHARRGIWEMVQGQFSLLVDPRMGAETLTIKAVEACVDEEWYADTLEGTALPAVCTEKSLFGTGLIAGGWVAQTIACWVRGKLHNKEFAVDLRNTMLLDLPAGQTTR